MDELLKDASVEPQFLCDTLVAGVLYAVVEIERSLVWSLCGSISVSEAKILRRVYFNLLLTSRLSGIEAHQLP